MAPDIWLKPQKLDEGPSTPISELIDVAFKIFNNRDEEQREAEIRRNKLKKEEMESILLMTTLP